MASQGIYTIIENKNIAKDVYRLRLLGDTSALSRPGQFVNVLIQGQYLRRPISVSSYHEGEMVLIYKILGKGTAKMAELKPNDNLDLLVGLGNGFDIAKSNNKSVALIGGGVGLPPLYGLLESIINNNEKPKVYCVMGFRSQSDVFYEKEFEALGAKVIICTEDGSMGEKGYVTQGLDKIKFDYYYACGPQGMLKAVFDYCKARNTEGQLSFEERMGCGFGACMGCACETLLGYKKICVDGPVFESSEVKL